MIRELRTKVKGHFTTMVIAGVVAAVVGGTPAIAGIIADYAKNSDKVDRFHAVWAGATPTQRAGKLVATNSLGRLPNSIISTAPNSDKLGGLAPDAYATKLYQEKPPGTVSLPSSGSAVVDSLTLPAGKYLVTGRVVVGNPTFNVVDVYCGLGYAGAARDITYSTIGPGDSSYPSYSNFFVQYAHESTQDVKVDLFCNTLGASSQFAHKRNIAAIKVLSVSPPAAGLTQSAIGDRATPVAGYRDSSR